MEVSIYFKQAPVYKVLMVVCLYVCLFVSANLKTDFVESFTGR